MVRDRTIFSGMARMRTRIMVRSRVSLGLTDRVLILDMVSVRFIARAMIVSVGLHFGFMLGLGNRVRICVTTKVTETRVKTRIRVVLMSGLGFVLGFCLGSRYLVGFIVNLGFAFGQC